VSSEPRTLDRLLAAEIARRAPVIRDAPAGSELWAALHALKGSVAMAGHAELALLLSQARQRIAQDPVARRFLFELLERAASRLLSGLPPLTTAWPEPPPGLSAATVESRYRSEYRATMRDRLGQLDSVLSSHENAVQGLEQAQRSVHAMKGAAGALGDDVLAWYCHGLEARLRAALRTEPAARDVLVDLGRHRALLALLVDDPHRGLLTLQALARAERSNQTAQAAPTEARELASETPPPPAVAEAPLASSLHVPSEALTRFLERLDRVELVHDDLGRASIVARRIAARLREVRSSLMEALRLLGPARPWGPPLAAVDRLESAASSLRSVLNSAERGSQAFRQSADFLRARSDEIRGDLAELQRTSMGSVFERVAHAGTRLARAEGKLVRIEVSGAEIRIDRRVADRLYDALVQLIRNAIAHGIQSPRERLAQGRPEVGTLWLRAERHLEWLRVSVADDGRGANAERIRELALQKGALSPESARAAGENQLLSLLFLPGLTTHPDPSLLAGRGLGLDLVQEAARALGGAVRLEHREGGGLSAVFELPLEQSLTEVLWVEDGGHEFAVPATFMEAVRRQDSAAAPLRLQTCLQRGHVDKERRAQRPAELEIVLAIYGVEPVRLGIDRAGGLEEVTLRPIPRAIAEAGPYGGAILRSDGSLRLSLDVPRLLAQAFAP